jgi:hypothetical protein
VYENPRADYVYDPEIGLKVKCLDSERRSPQMMRLLLWPLSEVGWQSNTLKGAKGLVRLLISALLYQASPLEMAHRMDSAQCDVRFFEGINANERP